MKKLLGIVVLVLLFSTNAFSKTIYLKKCYEYVNEPNGKFDKKQYEQYYIKIDTSKMTLSVVNIHTEKYIKRRNAELKAEGRSVRVEKVFIWERPITYQDNNIVKIKGTGVVDLKKKKLTIGNLVRQCK